jgi:Zn-dependent peptidase ImmA (M78 family)
MGRVQALASKVVEHQVGLQKLLHADHPPRFPKRARVRTPADAERLAQLVRRSWKLGDAPLESVTRTIEDHGGVVVEVHGMDRGFDGLSGIADGRIPVLVINGEPSADRRRYTLAHELGHLAMTSEGVPEQEQEPLAHRFAAAFIVPEAVARHELGARRRHLDWSELQLLKLKHGLSMQAWIRRARDLEIIGPGLYTRLFRQIGSFGWRRVEPVVYDAERPPSKLRQLVLRAVAEGCISAAEADEILRDAVALGSRAVTAGSHRGALDLLYASAEERERRLSIAAEAAAEIYAADSEVRGFDAFGEKDLHDDPSPD